jgi:ABC-type spermidine/putrescine transport system permease subunit II
VGEVGAHLRTRVSAAVAAGIAPDAILVDPGIGFGKTIDHNLALLRSLPELAVASGAPLVVGGLSLLAFGARACRSHAQPNPSAVARPWSPTTWSMRGDFAPFDGLCDLLERHGWKGVLNLVIGTTAGYAYARYQFPLKTLSLFALLFTRMLPTVVLVPAFFLMLRALGLSNSLTGLVLAYCSFTLPFTVWIMKAYFETLPSELDQSALVDGCNRLQAYYRVVLPVSGPGLVAAGAFTFMLCWNEFIVAQVLNTKPGTTTLPPVIAGMNGQINIDYSVIAASGFLGALPAVLLVLVFQKYMVQGLTAGSVKG